MPVVPVRLFYRLLMQCGMGVRFDERSRDCREGSRAGSLLGEVSHESGAGHLTRLLDKLWEADAWAAQGGSQVGIAVSEVTNVHAKQAKVLAEGSAAPGEAASTICLRVCMFIALGIFYSCWLVESKHSPPQG